MHTTNSAVYPTLCRVRVHSALRIPYTVQCGRMQGCLTGKSPLKCCLIRSTLCKYAHVTSRDTAGHFHCLEGKKFMWLRMKIVKQSEKGRSILHLISRMRTAKAAGWKALHARNSLSLPSLSHSFQKMLWAIWREEDGKQKKRVKEEVLNMNKRITAKKKKRVLF